MQIQEREAATRVVTLQAELDAHKKLLEEKKKPPYDLKELEKLQKEIDEKKKNA